MDMHREQHEEFEYGNHTPKKPHKILKRVLWGLLILFALIIVFGAYKYFTLKGPINSAFKDSGIKKARNTEAVLAEGRPVSILLMGTDTGSLGRTDKGRTDTMIVVTLNPHQHQTTLTSIPRDTAVTIPGFEQESPAKINAAYAYGGAKTAIQTVQQMLNVPIDYYALVNMGGLKQIVDEVGGVKINPLLSFSYGGFTFKKGQPQVMKGKEALAYVRMRHQDPQGDFGREARQRQLIQGIVSKSGSVTTLLNKDFIKSIAKSSQTDLTTGNILTLAIRYNGVRRNVKSNHLDENGQMIQGQDMEVPTATSLQSVTDKIRSSLNLTPAKTGNAAYGVQMMDSGTTTMTNQY